MTAYDPHNVKHSSGIPMAYQPSTHDRYQVVEISPTQFIVKDVKVRANVFAHSSKKACQNKADKLNTQDRAQDAKR